MEQHFFVERQLHIDGEGRITTIGQLRDMSCVVLVGAAGLGKSTLMRAELASVKQSGGNGRFVRLDQFPTDADLIEAVLPMPAERRNLSIENHWNLYFDGFDESGEKPETLVRRISLCIRRIAESDLATEWLSIKVSTRSLELAQRISEAINPIFPNGATCVAVLQDLTDEEIRQYSMSALNGDHRFAEAINDDSVVKTLALRPLTLVLLVELYREHGQLPESHRELYRTAITSLLRNAGVEPEPAILSAARLAAVMTLSNRLTVWTGDSPPTYRSTSLTIRDLNRDGETAPEWLIPVLLRSGLMEQVAAYEIRWFHHSVAEYLTALQLDALGIPPDEALKLLQTRILGKPALRMQLKDTAAWLAASRHDFLRILLESEADIFLSSDVSIIDHAARKEIVASLLTSARPLGWYGFSDMSRQFARLSHPGLPAQLKDHLEGGTATQHSTALAIQIADACQLRELVGTFLDIALRQIESIEARVLSIHAIHELGSDDDRRKILSLTIDAGEADVDDEVRGAALTATWPRVLSAAKLFDRLTLPRNPNLIGGLRTFLYRLELPELDREAALAAVSWLSRSPAEYFRGSFGRPAQQALIRVWEACDDPQVLNALADLLSRHAEDRSHTLGELDVTSLDAAIRVGPEHRRHSLFLAIVDRMKASSGFVSMYLPVRILMPCDLEWLVSDLTDATLRARFGDVLVQVVVWLLRGCSDIREVEDTWNASESIPELASALASAFTIPLDSEAARLMRQQLEFERQRREQKTPHIETVVEQFESFAGSFDAGDHNAWWLANLALLADHNGDPDELKSPLDEGLLWRALSDSQRLVALRMARTYVENLQLSEGWLKPNQHHRPATAAYRAIRLLFKYEPETVERLIAGGISAWILPALTFGGNDTPEEVSVRSSLLRNFHSLHPKLFVDAIGDAVAALGGEAIDDVARLVGSWADEELLDAMWLWWSSNLDTKSLKHSTALRMFAKRSYEPLRRVFDDALTSATEADEPDDRLLSLADAMFEEQARTAKTWMIPLLRGTRKIAEDVLKEVSGYWSASVLLFLKSLSDDESVEVYSFAKDNIPSPPEDRGAHIVTALHSVEQLRQRLLKELAERGTEPSISALLTLRDKYRDQPWLQHYVDEGVKAARGHSTDWPPPADVLQMVFATLSVNTNVPAVPIAAANIDINAAVETVAMERPNPNMRTEEGRRFSFLLFATEWNSGHGGLSTINRELAKGLALSGQTVLCFVPRPTPEECRDAEAVGVRLLPGSGPDVMSVAEQLALGPDLEEDPPIDFVIGHDHITGPSACVWARRLDARYVHIVHTHPDEIASARLGGDDPRIFERADDKRNLQIELSKKAALVVAVGPLLRDYILTNVRNTVPVSRLDPGLTEDLLADAPDLSFLLEASCLFMGRGDDLHVKGLDRLAAAVQLLRDRALGSRVPTPIITFRGYSDKPSIEKCFGTGHRLRFHGFSANRDEVWQDLRSASVLLMPSRAEGFGLVAFEAISAGVPVLVSQESGVAMLLRTLADEGVIANALAEEAIVESTGDLEADADSWSDRIQRVMADRAAAFERALKLRAGLSHMTWAAAAQGVLDRLRSC